MTDQSKKLMTYLELNMEETARTSESVSLFDEDIALYSSESKQAVRKVVDHMLSAVTDILGKSSTE